jgi:hypothetical protein
MLDEVEVILKEVFAPPAGTLFFRRALHFGGIYSTLKK